MKLNCKLQALMTSDSTRTTGKNRNFGSGVKGFGRVAWRIVNSDIRIRDECECSA